MRLRIASYNIRKAVGLDWRRAPDRILAILQEINADVVLLQEADQRIGTRHRVLPLSGLDDLGYCEAPVAPNQHSSGWHGNACLLRKRIPIGSVGRLALPTLEPRGAIRVWIPDWDIELIGVHLALDPFSRLAQIARLRKRVTQTQHPTVIAGDFNHWGKVLHGFDPIGTVITPGPSFHASWPIAGLDRFVLCNGLASKIEGSFVHTSPLSRRGSDHLPVVLDLNLA